MSRCDQGNQKLQKSRLLNQMADLDSLLDSRILTEEEVAKKVELYLELEEVQKNEASVWRQKSRALWLKEGDKTPTWTMPSKTADTLFSWEEAGAGAGNREIEDHPIMIYKKFSAFSSGANVGYRQLSLLRNS
ncbi:hypothetical protein H5410_007260 [Solanum commersonii]|uniref:Uncharacterized protein n=1 Tax=Solanum commersonii TaxID=4109 RepID=A0A9J6ACZ3_SOLCO|nr:hypothetical protein H5410_007260 [Solanum commersonii]